MDKILIITGLSMIITSLIIWLICLTNENEQTRRQNESTQEQKSDQENGQQKSNTR